MADSSVYRQKIYSSSNCTTSKYRQNEDSEMGLSYVWIQTQLHVAASVETCEEIETRTSFPENLKSRGEVHPSQLWQWNVSVRLS